MAKIKKTNPIITRDQDLPGRKLNIFQRGIKGVYRFIRPIKPDFTVTVQDPDENGDTNPDPVGNDGTTSSDPGGTTSSTDPGIDPDPNPTNPINTDDMEPFIGEIRMFSGNFAPRGWALCDGQTLDITSYQALFSLISTYYGGDGRTTFKLPDLRGRVPIHQGQGQGLSQYPLGNAGGYETVSLTDNEIPEHSHSVMYSQDPADSADPESNLLSTGDHNHYSPGNPGSSMNSQMISATGGGHAHSNMQPYLTINYIIALEGIYPPRN